MNRKQRKEKIKRATRHKDVCKWLKGGMPRKYRKFRGMLVTRGIRISRKQLREMSERTFKAIMEWDASKPIEVIEL